MKVLQAAVLASALALSACATSPTGRSQFMVPNFEDRAIEASKEGYVQQLQPFKDAGRLNNETDDVQRVRRITRRLVPEAEEMRPDTKDWDWEVNVLDDPETVNAWCMAGGKMAVYTGLIEKINPTDDELAQIMGHEIGHALANHQAEKMSVAMGQGVGSAIAGIAVGILVGPRAGVATGLGAVAASQVVIGLPNSREAETEADRIGIELAAKAGYDPRAAVTLWQKMGALSGGNAPPEFLSTHPASETRQEALSALVPQMMPYYEAAKRSQNQAKAPNPVPVTNTMLAM